MTLTRAQVAQEKAEQIERQNKAKTVVYTFRKPCYRCVICGEKLDPITYVHANKHDYETKAAFIASGNVENVNRWADKEVR